MRAKLSWLLFCACIGSGPVVAQADAPAKQDRPAVAVTVIGASLSAGFVDGPLTGGSPDNRTTALHRVLQGWLGDSGAVRTRADLLMFQDPVKLGARQLARATKDGGDLLCAIDFLFWYGYGSLAAGDADEGKARQARLDLGLQQLDLWPGPILLADLPDMRGADRRMLAPRQIPADGLLPVLNERIAAWAKARSRAAVVPLRDWVAEMKERGIQLPLADGALQVPPGGLLQGDRLHPNRLGMAWLGFRLQAPARALLPEAQQARLPQWTIDQFVAASGAAQDVADLRADATGAKPANAGAGQVREGSGGGAGKRGERQR